VAIIAAALLAYSGSFGGPFVLDDDGTIGTNLTIRHFLSALSPPRSGIPVSGRPVANLSFAINYAISGTQVWSYHVVNLLIHLLAALVLFGIVRRTLVRAGRDRYPPTMLAFAIALLWAVHPLQTEAVAYLSQRVESLMGLFYLLTLYGFICSAEIVRPAPGAGSGQGWRALSIAACLLGMATKEAMVTAPLIVFLYDRTFVAGTASAAWRARKGYYAALASTWLVLAFLVVRTGSRGGTAGYEAGVPWWAYALTQIGAVLHYLRLSVWPHPLLADYGRILGGRPPEIAAGLAIELALAAATVAALLRPADRGSGRRTLGFAGAWFFVILAPSSSVVPVATEIIAEHRMYLPLAGVLAAIVGGAWAAAGELHRRLGWNGRAIAVSGGFALAAAAMSLAAATAVRNESYGSLLAFWGDIVKWAPENAGARNNLGNVLVGNGDLAGAVAQYREALRLAPDYVDAHLNLGNVLTRQDRLDEAMDHYRAALRFRPRDESVRLALGAASYRFGNSLAAAGRTAEAAEAYRTAVDMRPDFADAHVEYGNALAEQGRAAEAMREYRAALALVPGMADVHNNLGGLLAQAGRLPEAKAQFEEALRLKPDYREARDNLERVRRIEGNGARP
jgi:tetratricopeptide (TPR) repeat protein